MTKGICKVPVAAVRSDSSHRSEMTTQLLYGETVDVLEENSRFIRIKMHFDGYEGWVDRNQIAATEADDESLKKIITEPVQWVDLPEGRTLLSLGSEVKGGARDAMPPTDIIGETARQFLNVPYLWSGRSFFGTDCSGFVQLVYKIHGIRLPREAWQQADKGNVLSFIEESRPGDLAFFENEDGMITHVGMMLNQEELIHAYGKVRIDMLDSTGIFNRDLNRHTHRLRFIRTYF